LNRLTKQAKIVLYFNLTTSLVILFLGIVIIGMDFYYKSGRLHKFALSVGTLFILYGILRFFLYRRKKIPIDKE